MTPFVRKIVVPVDFTRQSECAASYACALAGEIGAKVYLIHVLSRSPLRIRERVRISGSCSADARSRLARLASLHPAVPIATEVRAGGVAENIKNAVIAYGADMIVMAAHGRTAWSHLFAGSVTNNVSHSAACPVLVMRESGQLHQHTAA